MNIQQELMLRVSNSSLKDIAALMGYSPQNQAKAGKRIHKVINDEYLGLDEGGFDLKYSNREFLVKLCEVLGLDRDQCSRRIDAMWDELGEYRERYHPRVFIDTNFKRTSQPIFVLAFMAGRRWIYLSKDTLILPMHEQVKKVGKLLRQHYQKSEGKLDMWGPIQYYKYYYEKDQFITFDTRGVVVDTDEGKAPASTTLTVGGRDVTTVIKAEK